MSNKTENMFKHRLVHIDLKGAPFRLNYWQQLLEFLSRIGVNGLLIEYEDMFPYNDFLSVINSEDVYSREQLECIIGLANKYQLMIIPLIQTFGHLEFVLKHDSFRDLREVSAYPNSLCPKNDRSLHVIRHMIEQVVSLHQMWTQLKVIHIGCDEVWHMGCCSECRPRDEETGRTQRNQLFVDYVVKLAQFVRNSFGINVIIWDDMIRGIDAQTLIGSELNKWVEPMVWHYLDGTSFRLRDGQFWLKYKQWFDRIWIASAFKGASKMNETIPPIDYHISNHLAWVAVIEEHHIHNIEGLALTGWQRFDHMTTLCELFPNSVISLVMCLWTLRDRAFDRQTQEKASTSMGSKRLIPIHINSAIDLGSIESHLYPGADLFKLCVQLKFLINDFSSLNTNQRLHSRLIDLRVRLESEMKNIFFESTIEEWIQTNVSRFVKKLEKIVSKGDQQLAVQLKHNQMQE